MKGLLLKDWLTIRREIRGYLILTLAFLIIPGLAHFSIFFCALMPITALGYDERCKWDRLARMMPYSSRDIVASKYVLGYLMVAAAVLLGLLIQGTCSILNVFEYSLGECFLSMVRSAAPGFIVMAIELPIIFRFGVEKTRLFLTLFAVFVITGLGTTLSTASVFLDGEGTAWLWDLPKTLALVGIALAVQPISIMASTFWYRRNKKE